MPGVHFGKHFLETLVPGVRETFRSSGKAPRGRLPKPPQPLFRGQLATKWGARRLARPSDTRREKERELRIGPFYSTLGQRARSDGPMNSPRRFPGRGGGPLTNVAVVV